MNSPIGLAPQLHHTSTLTSLQYPQHMTLKGALDTEHVLLYRTLLCPPGRRYPDSSSTHEPIHGLVGILLEARHFAANSRCSRLSGGRHAVGIALRVLIRRRCSALLRRRGPLLCRLRSLPLLFFWLAHIRVPIASQAMLHYIYI